MVKKKFGNPQATFSDRVIKIALSIPKGKVMTYGQIAQKAGGGSMASRSVTGILGKAYKAGQRDIPFHRIVYANGRVWMTDEYARERLKKYKKEGIRIDSRGRIMNFEEVHVQSERLTGSNI